MSENIEVTQVHEKISQIKDSAVDWFTNFYMNDEKLEKNLQRKKISCISSEQTIVLIHQRKDLKNIYFFTSNLNDLVDMLKQISTYISEPMTINFPMNVRDDSKLKLVSEKIAEAGFNHYATQKRLTKINSNSDGSFQKLDGAWFARKDDCDEIEEILQKNLDYLADQFPDTDEIRNLVEEKKFLVARDESTGKIASIIGFNAKKNVIEWIFWITREEFRNSDYGLDLRDAFLKIADNIRKNITYVRENKMKRFHEMFGFRIDGFQNHVFLKLVQDIDEIKQAKNLINQDMFTGGVLSNLFVNDVILETWIKRGQIFLHSTADGFLLIRARENFCQLYFQTTNINSLLKQIESLVKNFNAMLISVDLINISSEVIECFKQAGFIRYVSLTRMVQINKTLKNPTAEDSWFAESRDVDEIENILYENMDPLCEQIPDREDIAEAVENRQIIVARTEKNIIAALLFFERKGKTATLRFWAGRKIFHGLGYGKLVYDRYMAKNSDATRFLLWVRDDNSKVKKIYERYGLQYENMQDVVFLFRGGS